MPLTSRLKDKDSSIRTFLETYLPNARDAINLRKDLIQKTSTILPKGAISYSIVGTALDYRIRYYFGITPFSQLTASRSVPRTFGGYFKNRDENGNIIHSTDSMEDEGFKVVAYIPKIDLSPSLIDDFASNLDREILTLNPVGRYLGPNEEIILCRYCLVLAHFEHIYRSSALSPELLMLPENPTIESLLKLANENEVTDLCELSWAFYKSYPELCTKEAILNPVFAGSTDVGGADADIIVDRCLIEIKTTIKPSVQSLWLYQLIGYVLLDYDNAFQIERVGIYLSRQQLLLEWNVDELLAIMAQSKTIPIDKLRAKFQRVVKPRKRRR